MHQNITLLEKNILFSGSYRNVYPHPFDKDLLIKVMNTNRWDRKSKFQKKYLHQYFFTKVFVRETVEYIHLHGTTQKPYNFIQSIAGFCITNLGFGLVVKAEFSADGTYAKTLKQLIVEKQVNDDVIKHLAIFVENILSIPIVISDLQPGNIVYAYDRENRTYHFVLIDGTGDKTFIPIHKMFSIISKHKKLKYINYLKEMIKSSEMTS